MRCSRVILLMLYCATVFAVSVVNSVAAADAPFVIPQGVITLPGNAAPPLVLKDLDGKPFDLKNRRGHWVFVHFWASWCGPCRHEMPTIQQMAKHIDSDKLEIVLVNTAEDDDRVFNFIGIVAPQLTPLMDYDGRATEVWQPRGLPSTFLIDPEGRRRYLVLGGRKWDSPEYLGFLQHVIKTR